MSALTADRNTQRDTGDIRQYGVAAGVKIFAGAIVLATASGLATKGQVATGLYGIGRAEQRVDNSAGGNGDLMINVREGIFTFGNSAAADQITVADVGGVCYAVDDQTVAKTSGSGTRSPAGKIEGIDALGNVLVKMGPQVLADFRKVRKRVVPLILTTIAGAGSPAYRVLSPVSGLLTRIQTIAEAALTTGDAILTASINGVAVTNGVITVTQAGSAAGDKDVAIPTAANYVAAGDELKIVVTGTEAAAVRANLMFEIDAD